MVLRQLGDREDPGSPAAVACDLEVNSYGAGPSVIRNAYRTVLKPILNTAVEQNLIRVNPLSIGERIKLPRPAKDEALFLNPEEVEMLADGDHGALRNAHPVRCVYRAPCRRASRTPGWRARPDAEGR